MASIFSLLTLKSFITVDKDLHELDKRKIEIVEVNKNNWVF